MHALFPAVEVLGGFEDEVHLDPPGDGGVERGDDGGHPVRGVADERDPLGGLVDELADDLGCEPYRRSGRVGTGGDDLNHRNVGDTLRCLHCVECDSERNAWKFRL